MRHVRLISLCNEILYHDLLFRRFLFLKSCYYIWNLATESTLCKLTSCGLPTSSVPSSSSTSAFSPAVKSSAGSKASAASSASSSSSSLGNFSAEVLSKSSSSGKSVASSSSSSGAVEQAQALAAAQLYEMRLSELLAAGIPPPGLTPAEAAGFGIFGGGFEQLPLAHSALMSHYASSLGGLALGGPLVGALPSPPTLPPSSPTPPARVTTPTNKNGERDKVSAHPLFWSNSWRNSSFFFQSNLSLSIPFGVVLSGGFISFSLP